MGIILFSGCSVTKHLPEGEVLYTGGKTVIQNKSTTPVAVSYTHLRAHET